MVKVDINEWWVAAMETTVMVVRRRDLGLKAVLVIFVETIKNLWISIYI